MGYFSDYQEIIKGLINARKAFGESFDGIGIDTWGVDYVLVDKKEEFSYTRTVTRDDRTDQMMEHAFKI